MAIREWFRPPRHLLLLFVGITLVLATALAWLGWRLLRQDRALEIERTRERLEGAATLVAGALERQLAETEAALTRLARLPAPDRPAQTSRWAQALAPGGALLVMTGETVAAVPPRRLVFLPALPPSADPPGTTFAAGESVEFRSRNHAAAVQAYRLLAKSVDPRVRAGALLREGRALRKTGGLSAALDAYARLAAFDSLPLEGLPAGLLARHARVSTLESLGRSDDARLEAASLYGDLLAARWPLTRGGFEFYTGDLERRLAAPPPRDTGSMVALARAAEVAWRDWLAAPAPLRSVGGRRVIWSEREPALAIWVGGPGSRLVLIANPEYFRAAWLAGISGLLEREGVRVAVDDLEGNVVLSQLQGDLGPQVLRTAAETQLPFTLRVASADPASVSAEMLARRRLMLGGFAVAALLVLFGTYAVGRAVNRELEVARLQSDFVAAVSHEFRTPLTAMRQLTELLAGGRVAGEERRLQYYDVLKREGERLHRLVEGLLDFGRMEAGAREFRFDPVDPAALTREVVDQFQPEANRQGYQIELDTQAVGKAVPGDREALVLVLWNLLDNALRYSPEHRTVWVTVKGENGRVAISVRDRGAGIPANERERIFQKFVRGSSARVTNVKGTGIGLALVRHIVDAHGGEVRLESEPGVGSTFTVLLPGAPA